MALTFISFLCQLNHQFKCLGTVKFNPSQYKGFHSISTTHILGFLRLNIHDGYNYIVCIRWQVMHQRHRLSWQWTCTEINPIYSLEPSMHSSTGSDLRQFKPTVQL